VLIRVVLLDCVAGCLCLLSARLQIIIVDKLATCLFTIKRDDGLHRCRTDLSFHIHFPQFREMLRSVLWFVLFVLQNKWMQLNAGKMLGPDYKQWILGMIYFLLKPVLWRTVKEKEHIRWYKILTSLLISNYRSVVHLLLEQVCTLLSSINEHVSLHTYSSNN
jgi:hypothetical protein